MKKIYTKTQRPARNAEINKGPKLVEKQGYIPAKARIEQMIDAGQRLSESRKEQYDFGAGEKINENYIDPTRNPNFDLVEAHDMKVELNEKLEETEKKIKKEKKQENLDKYKKEAYNIIKAEENEKIRNPDGIEDNSENDKNGNN